MSERFPRVQKVIVSQVRVGSGLDASDPVRLLLQIHTLDGVLLAEGPDAWGGPNKRLEHEIARKQGPSL